MSENPTVWLIDGFNVLNVAILQREERVDFWGPAARGRLLDLIAARPDAAAVIIVFDGSRPAPLDPAEADCLGAARAEVVFADDADEWLLRRVREDREPGRIAVVTADRRLAARAHRRGAQIVAPSRFVAECRHTGEAGGETLTEHAPAPRGDRVCAVAKKLKPRA